MRPKPRAMQPTLLTPQSLADALRGGRPGAVAGDLLVIDDEPFELQRPKRGRKVFRPDGIRGKQTILFPGSHTDLPGQESLFEA